MTDTQRRAAAKQFAADWQGKGYEKGHSQTFWLSLLQKVYGVEEPDKFITFEDQIMLDHTSFIDGFIPSTHVLIEQKSLGKELNKPIKQSDGSLLSPFQQAKRYAAELPYSQRPRWIVTCNFAEFYVYDMERPTGDPEVIKLCDLEKEYYRLQFLVDTGDTNIKKEMEVSLQAGEIVGVLYDALLKQYKDPEAEDTLKSLNALCVRLVFGLYAEDAGIFGSKSMFHDYLRDIPAGGVRKALVELFRTLDQKPEQRDKYLADDNPALAAFPYVNGGLFSDENIEIPPFTEELKSLLLERASEDFDWSAISPTIFGAVFESTLNPETRRSGGMHYTSIENIHKVIDPLFLDGLRAELEELKEIAVDKTRRARLGAFQSKLAGLTFLDPACGSGNFLTETYLSLRKLENEVLRCSTDQISMDLEGIIQVSIGQFYGIEINDFAVTVAKTALWIAESQMMKETEDVVHMSLDFLPLKSYANITEGNALRLDWESVVPKDKLNYIMGNPPFVGFSLMKAEQKEDVSLIFPGTKNVDYVACWYMKAIRFIRACLKIVIIPKRWLFFPHTLPIFLGIHQVFLRQIGFVWRKDPSPLGTFPIFKQRLRAIIDILKKLSIIASPGLPPPTRRRPKSSRPPRLSWTPAPSTRTAPLPTYTTRSPCPRSCGKPTSRMTGPSCRPMGSTWPPPPKQAAWRS